MVGFFLVSIGQSFFIIPFIHEVVDAFKEKYKIRDNSLLNYKASGIFNASVAVGCILGPLMGGLLKDLVGYRETCDLMGVLSLACSIVYLVFNMKLKDFKFLKKNE